MFFDKALQIALIIFFIGLAYRLLSWFIKNVGTGDQKTPVINRIFSGIEGIILSIFSIKFFSLIRIFIVDVLFQIRILTDKKDPSSWIMHILIFVGFMSLFFLHALDIPRSISSDYYSTMNPFMFLRNIFGLMVITGLALAILRRTIWMKGEIKTGGRDVYAIVLLAVIIISGFALEGLKIGSYAEYQRMVTEYGDVSDLEEKQALEAYWVKNFGVVSPEPMGKITAGLLSKGKELHEMSCAACHANPRSAFISYSIAKMIKPFALGLDRSGVRNVMWYIHILACLIGLAYLAFSKMFHVISTPINLFLAEVAEGKQNPASAATRQMIELDGCSHGGTCHQECPVYKKRLVRIERTSRYGPMLDYIGEKTTGDLGSRKVAQ